MVTADGLELTEESQPNWNFVAHIIKDVFDPVSPVVAYGVKFGLIDALRAPEFGIETWGLHSEPNLTRNPPNVHSWRITHNGPYYGTDFASLVVSIGYKKDYKRQFLDLIAFHMYEFVKNDAYLMIVDPGNWVGRFDAIFMRQYHLEEEIKRYSIFKDSKVLVFKK